MADESLKVTKAEWEDKPENGWLLRQLYNLLLSDPDDLTDRDAGSKMPGESIEEEIERGER